MVNYMRKQRDMRLMNKLEVGMYVRSKSGIISKFERYITDKKRVCETDVLVRLAVERIVKASYNIIKLIEEGDILLLFDKEYGKEYKAEVVVDSENFTAVINYEQNDLLILEYELITNEHIELLKILTKEQFESMSYGIGE